MADVVSEENSAGPPRDLAPPESLIPSPKRHCFAPQGWPNPRAPLGSRKTSEAKRSAEQTTEMLWQRSYAR